MFSLTNTSLFIPYPDIDLPQFSLSQTAVWTAGPVTLTDPGGPGSNIFSSPDIMTNGSALYSGPPGSNTSQFAMTNNAWLVEENSSILYTADLTGSGDLTDVGSTTVIFGQGATSETIGLTGNSHLFLGMQPGLQFLSPIDLDSTSTVTLFTSPQDWGSIIAAESHQVSLGPPDANLIAKAICPNIASLTSDYQPELIFGYNAQNGIASVGIRDVLIPGHTA